MGHAEETEEGRRAIQSKLTSFILKKKMILYTGSSVREKLPSE